MAKSKGILKENDGWKSIDERLDGKLSKGAVLPDSLGQLARLRAESRTVTSPKVGPVVRVDSEWKWWKLSSRPAEMKLKSEQLADVCKEAYQRLR